MSTWACDMMNGYCVEYPNGQLIESNYVMGQKHGTGIICHNQDYIEPGLVEITYHFEGEVQKNPKQFILLNQLIHYALTSGETPLLKPIIVLIQLYLLPDQPDLLKEINFQYN